MALNPSHLPCWTALPQQADGLDAVVREAREEPDGMGGASQAGQLQASGGGGGWRGS